MSILPITGRYPARNTVTGTTDFGTREKKIVVEPLRPTRGGFFRPFGTGEFIKAFLSGRGPDFGAPAIDPEVGSCQSDIHAAYKGALHRAMAEDAAAFDAEEAIRKGKPLTPEEVERRQLFYLQRIPYKLTKMRYQSFHTYFGNLKRLGWVEETGISNRHHQ